MLILFKKIYNLFFSHFNSSNSNGSELNKKIAASLLEISKSPASEILQKLQTSELGLVESDAEDRIKQYGLNEISHDKVPTWYVLLLKSFRNPFILLLLFLAVVSFLLHNFQAVVIIVVMVTISVIIRFSQEFSSTKAAEKLKALVSTKATVLRREGKQDIDLKYVVPGDIIHLSAGDMLPADMRLITAKDLFVSQASLTGESLPVEKEASINGKGISNPIEMHNMCYMGTDVLNGTAMGVVVKTGNHTYFGSMAKNIVGYRPSTSFDIGINKVTWLLIRFVLIMVPAVFLINGFTKGDWLQALLFALSVAVGLTPEMLPMIVTANLAKGAVKMSHKKVIVKRLNAIQNFGAMDILCTDKTGTLTQNRIILDKYLDVDGEESDHVLNYGYLNSYYQTGLKNLLDHAILDHGEVESQLQMDKEFSKVDEIPFDFNRRRMSVVLERRGQHLLICKGAVEEIMSICTEVKTNGSIVPFSEDIKNRVIQLTKDLNEDGLRVLAIGYKEFPMQANKTYKTQDETSLILLGVLAFLDPPKHTTAQALATLKTYNVQVKVLTGDNELITRKTCKNVKLKIEGSLSGDQIEKMSDLELKNIVDKTTIFTKLSPLQKSRIIASLKSNKHTVGYLGDGINDAPALREADIGISVDSAVDIAKESADIIMIEKSLLFLGEGVIEGRKTFGNIIKYIKMAVSSNFGNVFSVLGASAFLPFLPMQSIQLLVQNLLYDISQISLPFDNVEKDFLVIPRKWDPSGIARFMVFIGPISSIFDYTTFAIMWFFFAANSPEKQALFQSGWFIEGLLSQTLIVHMIRTPKIPFFQSMASLPLLLTTAIVMGVGIYIPYSFVAPSLGLVPLPWSYFPWLFSTLLCYCVLTQIVKVWFIKKFHYWL